MGHQQPPTLVVTDIIVVNSIINVKAKNISRAIDMIFYSVRDRILQNHFHIFWEEGKKNLANYVTKHHPIWLHRKMRPIYVNKKKDIQPQNTGELGPGEGVLELPIQEEPRNQIILLREIRIQFPRTRIIPLRESEI